MNLSNFYEDYAFNPDDFEVLEGMYKSVAKHIYDYIHPLQDNRIARYMEDYRIVPAQYLDVSTITYLPENILPSEELKKWSELETEDQVQILKENGLYIRLVADRQLLSSVEYEGDTFDPGSEELKNQIIDFDLWETDESGYKLVQGLDYYYKDNKVFLLGDFAIPNNKPTMLKMTDIAIDFNTVDDMLGKNLELKFLPEKMPKIEFNDYVRNLTLAVLQGFVFKNLMSGVNMLPTVKSDIEIFDKNTLDPEKAAMWKDGELGLGPFDYVVYFPASLDYYRVSLICQLLDKMQFSSSHYHSIGYDENRETFGGDITDELRDFIEERTDYEYPEISYDYADELEFNDVSEDVPFDYADSDIVDTEIIDASDKTFFTDRETSLLDDANSRLAFASDEDMSS